jgi:hypothetical protein
MWQYNYEQLDLASNGLRAARCHQIVLNFTLGNGSMAQLDSACVLCMLRSCVQSSISALFFLLYLFNIKLVSGI